MAPKKSASSSHNIVAKRPLNVLLRPVTIDYKELFKALAKGIGHTAVQKWDELANDALALLTSFGLETNPSDLAYELVQRALITSLFDLLADSSTSLELADGIREDDILASIASLLDDEPVQLDEGFLDRPGNIPLISQTQRILSAWLDAHSPHKVGDVIAARFPSYFIYALNNEWRKNEKRYAPLRAALDTPFTKASDREWRWSTYSALLQKRIEEPSFDEAFSLQQIFIPPYAYYHERSRGAVIRLEESTADRESTRRVVVKLETELSAWLKSSNAEDAVRVISGGPGSGKSSFSRIFAAKTATFTKTRVLFIPLHLIDPIKDLVDEVGRFVSDEGILADNPLSSDTAEQDLLVIFDGLDELASQGKAAAEVSRAFIREVEKTVQRRNLVSVRLRVIISGRELVVQENESDFRKNRQILNLLPYYVAEEERRNSSLPDFFDPQGLLKDDLRNAWWTNYGQLTNKQYSGLPSDLQRRDLDEITAQPLLNYLVALSFTRGELDFTKDINLNQIYADLVSAVHERGYEKHRTFGPIRQMTAEQFSRILEEIGLAAWHGDGRTTSVSEIEQHCHNSGVGQLLELFQDGAQAGVTRLLAAFFFRKHGQRSSGEATFVFTHKSFGEYLAAKRICLAVGRITRELQRRVETFGEGWDEREALRHWISICGPTAVSTYIHTFISRELASQTSARENQLALERLFSHVLRHGTPMELIPAASFRVMLNNARNAEESLLVCLNSCARKTQIVSELGELDPTSFGTWFRRVQGQRTGPVSSVAAQCLSYLNLSGSYFDIGDFYQANLSYSNLRSVQANLTNFGFALLQGTDLSGSTLSSAELFGADLRGAVLFGAIVEDANFRDAHLEGANFEKAVINVRKMNRKAFKSVDLSKAILQDNERPNEAEVTREIRRRTQSPQPRNKITT